MPLASGRASGSIQEQAGVVDGQPLDHELR